METKYLVHGCTKLTIDKLRLNKEVKTRGHAVLLGNKLTNGGLGNS